MKKLFTALFILISFLSFGQQFPNNPPQGSVNTNNHFVGAVTGDRGVLSGTQIDTTAWNLLSYVKNVPFIEVNTSLDGKKWRRNSTATKWVEVGKDVSDGWFNIVRDGGADTTGATDVSPIFIAAMTAGWRNFYAPKGSFLISNQIQMKDSTTIMGAGRFATIFKLTTDIAAFKATVGLGGNQTTFRDLGFYGDYSTGGLTTQIGISIDSAQKILITNISGVNMGGFVVNIIQNGNCCVSYVNKAGKSNTISDSYFEANYGGVNLGERAEYNVINNCTFTLNTYGIQCSGGNNRINSNSVENNTNGLYMTGGTNNGHGVASGNTFNHNGTNLYMNGVDRGFSFVNNTFSESNLATAGLIELISSSNVNFSDNIILRDTIRTTACTKITFTNNVAYLGLVARWVNVSGDAPTVFKVGNTNNALTMRDVVNTRTLDLTMPTLTGNWVQTFPNKTGTFAMLSDIADSSGFWRTTGNAGTVAGANFLGTTDAADLMFKRNSVKSGLINLSNLETSFGYQALLNNAGSYNTAFGTQAASLNTSGLANTAVGAQSLYSNISGINNTIIGATAGYFITGGSNTGIGTGSLGATTSGSGNVGIGAYGGAYGTTQSNRVYINSLDRTNILGDTTKSIIYGAQDATAENQRLYLNSKVYTPYSTNNSSQNRIVGMISGTGENGFLTVSGLSISGGVLSADVTLSNTTTLTNKRWTARVGNTASSATPTINTDNVDIYKLTAQAADITSFTTNLSGTPVDGDILEIQITGTAARAITWGASFVSSTVTLPTTTVTTATLTIIVQYFTTSSYGNNKWVCVNYF